MTPEELWESCRAMALAEARRHHAHSMADLEDLEQAALLALWQAALAYRDCGTQFSTYSHYYVVGGLKKEGRTGSSWGESALRNARRRGEVLPVLGRFYDVAEYEAGREDDGIRRVEDSEYLSYLLDCLERESVRTAARRYFVELLPVETIARQMAMTPKYVQTLLREACQEMREASRRQQE